MARRGLAAALLLLATAAQASPWLRPDDRQARADVELLAAAGLIRAPVSAWPLPWAAVRPALRETSAQPPHVVAAIRRLAARDARENRPLRLTARADATNDAALVRDFGAHARSDVDTAVGFEANRGRLTLTGTVGSRSDQRGSGLNVEDSAAIVDAGGWALYAGTVDSWWGPGNDRALLLSTGARPFPKVGIKRLGSSPIDVPVLRWLGPWRADIFAGVLTGRRTDFHNPGIIAMRVIVAPARGLEIGLQRGLQLCGRSRPCGVGTIGRALIGLGDADNTGTPNEPGNQLAGYDISYTRLVGSVAAKVYAEAMAEDEDNVIVDKYSYLAGGTLTGPLGQGGASWRVGFEWSDTLARKFPFGRRYPGTTYNNGIYTSGFTFRDRALGHSLGGDARLLTLSGALTDARDRRLYGSLRLADVNRKAGNPISGSATPERIRIATLGAELPIHVGRWSLEGRIQDNDVDTPGRSPMRGQVEIGWRMAF